MTKNKMMALAELYNLDMGDFIQAMIDEDQLIEQCEYNDNSFEYDDQEFLICTDEEADREHTDCIENLWDDLGLESFSEYAQEFIINNFALNSDYFDGMMKESYESYCEDIKTEDQDEDEEGNEINRLTEEMEENECETEEDYVEFLCSNYSDDEEWYKENFGEDAFLEVAKRHLSFDINAIAEYCRETDGRGHSLAGYDGVENEIDIDGETFYIYRTN